MIVVGTGLVLPSTAAIGEMFYCTQSDSFMIFNGQQWTTVVGSWGWSLFIDDIRNPEDVALSGLWSNASIRLARTVEDAIRLIETHELPELISFDHDLGADQPAATKIMWHLINGHLDEKWDCSKIKEVTIHSANPVGSRNLLLLWKGFCDEFGLPTTIRLAPALK